MLLLKRAVQDLLGMVGLAAFVLVVDWALRQIPV